MKFLKHTFFIIGVLFLINTAYSINSFTIKQITVNGLQRIELGTVYSYLPVKTGDIMTNNEAVSVIKKLYNTGFFKDIKLEQQGNTLIVNVVERPIISGLSVVGDHVFDHKILMKSLKNNGLADGEIFDQSLLDQAVLGLKAEYYNRGLYSVVITTKVTQLERNRVNIAINIQEGPVAKIASIQFVGNKKFSQNTLRREMFLSTENVLSWWNKDNQYSSEKLAGDIEKVRFFYLNRGYMNFKLNSVQVQISSDKKSIYITLNITEGDQFKVGNVTLAGDLKNIPKSQVEPLITIKSGDIVDQTKIIKIVNNIKSTVGNYGYAFAMINPVPHMNIDNNTMDFTFFIDTGKKIYVKEINIIGNEKTRDVIVRREIRQPERALYNESAILRSKSRLDLLGYFKQVDVTTDLVPDSNNEVDLNVKLQEVNTGNINFGIGYAQGQGLLLNGSLEQANLFGSGKSLKLSASTSKLNRNLGLSFTDPYFRLNGTSLGYDLYENAYTPNNVSMSNSEILSPYSTKTLGARVRMGVPVSEFDKINFGLGFENTFINLTGNDVPQRFMQFTQQYGNSVNIIPLSASWVRNTTDSLLWPTKGALFEERVDGTLPLTGVNYYRMTSNNTWFIPISDDFVFKTKLTLGFINSYGNSTVPFYQNYFAGGITSLPGYAINTLGAKDTDGISLGGTREVIFTNELLFPLPGLKNDRMVRLGAFFNMGSLWGGNDFDLTPAQVFRASYGIGLTWISPLGPLRLSYAWPLFYQATDRIEPFQFMVGASF